MKSETNWEEIYLNESLKYKKIYDELSWWKFKARSEAKSMWYSARSLMLDRGMERISTEKVNNILNSFKGL